MNFKTNSNDLAFYQRMGVREPMLDPNERRRRRLMFRNERNLYRRTCSATNRSIISIHNLDAPFPVYAQDYWWGDTWDALSYGREVDFNRPFFEQWGELYYSVPQIALNAPRSENCEYTNQSEGNKDCYLVFSSNDSQGCYHGMWYQACRDSVDCLYLESSELCYEVLNGERCYNCAFCENLQDANDCFFCANCIGCSNCIGCTNLSNKRYWIDNYPSTKAEYEHHLAKMALGIRANIIHWQSHYQKLFSTVPQKYYIGRNCEEFSGNYLQNVKNALFCYNCRHCENIKYSHDAWDARNCFDLTETTGTDFCLELEGSERTNDCSFSMKQSFVSNAAYCSHCYNSNYLFGCVGLRKQEYCILNRRYSKEDFENLQSKIISLMLQTGEWGEYFPARLAPFPYNKSVAQEYFPLTKAEALNQGLKWYEKPMHATEPAQIFDVLNANIKDIGANSDDIAYSCANTKRLFRVTAAEIKFYRQQNLALPHLCPDERHRLRMNRRAPRTLLSRTCAGCGIPLESSYSSTHAASVYCQNCYADQLK